MLHKLVAKQKIQNTNPNITPRDRNRLLYGFLKFEFRFWIRSDKGLTLGTSALECLNGGQMTLPTELIKPNINKTIDPVNKKLSNIRKFGCNILPILNIIRQNVFAVFQAKGSIHYCGSRDGAVVRALASHQCGLGSIPGLGVICGLSLLLVLISAPRVFLRYSGFPPSTKIPIRTGNSEEKSRTVDSTEISIYFYPLCNRPIPSYFEPKYEIEAKCKAFYVKNSFAYI